MPPEDNLTKYLPEVWAPDSDVIDLCVTCNFDERYSTIYPSFNQKDELVNSIAKYPSQFYSSIKSLISKTFNIQGSILLGCGSEDLILRINSLIGAKNYRVGVVQPIFYRITETLKPDSFEYISEKQFIEGSWPKGINAIWLQNPNFFSANVNHKEEIVELIRHNEDVLFIVDEAGMFSIADYGKYSLVSCSHEFPNIIVLSSLSKMFGISGLRAGFASGPDELLSSLETRGLTFPWTSLTCLFAESALTNINFIDGLRSKAKLYKLEIENLLTSMDHDNEIKKNLTPCIFLRNQKINNLDKLSAVGIKALSLDGYLKEKGWIRIIVHSSDIIHKDLVSRLNKIIQATNSLSPNLEPESF
jgi:histidinol-phosphate/aromatic aminotransferase/cobyric acid decarboxylase-like protein